MDVQAFSTFFALLAVGAQLFVLAALGMWVGARLSPEGSAFARRTRDYVAPAALPFAWIVAATSTAGSLYYSQVAGYVPCELCWYQRIAMYPMALLLGIAALKRDSTIARYLIPLALAGSAISVYHYQLQRFPGQHSAACSLTAPCNLTYVWKFHYISIPLMALSGFLLIVTLLRIASASEQEPRAAADREEELVHR